MAATAIPAFTFHNVSIKTSAHAYSSLLPTLFTVHNVSIKTRSPGKTQGDAR